MYEVFDVCFERDRSLLEYFFDVFLVWCFGGVGCFVVVMYMDMFLFGEVVVFVFF